MIKPAYSSPKVTTLGTVEGLTAAPGNLNKVGGAADALTHVEQNVIGSFTPYP